MAAASGQTVTLVRFAVLVFLPLDVDHLVAFLEAVEFGRGVEFDAAIEGVHVFLIHGGLDLVGVDGAGLFDGLLQDQARGIAPGAVVGGLLLGIWPYRP